MRLYWVSAKSQGSQMAANNSKNQANYNMPALKRPRWPKNGVFEKETLNDNSMIEKAE